MCFIIFVGYIELYLANIYTWRWVMSNVHLCLIAPHVWFENRIESTRRFLLKNRSKSIVHLKAGIVTALFWCIAVFVTAVFRRYHIDIFIHNHVYRAAWNADVVWWWEFCLSVLLSNVCIVTKWKKNQSKFFMPYERSFSLVFWKEEWLVGATPTTWNFGSAGPRWSEIADFEPIFAPSASTLTLIGSRSLAFQWV